MLHTFTSMTYNLWGGWDLEHRSDALTELLRRRSPDLLGVQELHPDAVSLIDSALPQHQRVQQEAPGWTSQGNLWWDAELFSVEGHGASDVGLLNPDAALFWVRLRSVLFPELPALVYATVHLTFPGHRLEKETERSPRTAQAAAVAEELNRLAVAGPVILCIDINDYARPLWALYDRGFREPFGYFGRTCPITHPVTPRRDRSLPWDDVQTVEKAIDWQFFRGPVRPRNAEVIDFFLDGVAPSDHKPVMATFSIGGGY